MHAWSLPTFRFRERGGVPAASLPVDELAWTHAYPVYVSDAPSSRVKKHNPAKDSFLGRTSRPKERRGQWQATGPQASS